MNKIKAMNCDVENLKPALKKAFIGGFNIEIQNDKVELEVFRADFLNAPIQIKNENSSLKLHKRYCNDGSYYLSYRLCLTS